jgi:parallel beta-helix repeat protein
VKKITAFLLVCMLVIGSLIGFLSIIPTNVNAAGPTYVSGPITSNTVWSVANSPYIVQSDVFVTNGTLLTINAGVTVKFDGLYSLIVNGTLDATGTSGQPILFTSNQSLPNKSDWNRVRLQGKNNKMDYCKIQYGNYPLYIMGNDTNNIISHCKIENSSGDGVYLKETSNNTLSNIIVSYCNSNGITVLMSDDNLITNCFSHHNKAFGIYLRTATNNTILNSNSSKNNGGGFELSLKSHYNILKNVKAFDNQDNGVDFCGNGFNTILDSEIVGNNVNGIDMGGKAEQIWIENCIINNNGEAGIDLKTSTYSDIVSCDITYNFGEAGIYTAGRVSYINITDSYICSNYDDGIEIYGGRYVNITDSEISNNMWNGIYFNGYEVQEYNLVDSCMISGNSKNGIYLYTYSYSTSNIQNNKISFNTIYSNFQNGIFLHAHGYYYTSASPIYAIIQYNSINNNTVFSNNVNGIYIEAQHDNYYTAYADYNDISDNSVYLNTQNGIYLCTSSKGYSWTEYNDINNNIVYLNDYNGILLEAAADQYNLYINYNNIHNNKIYLNTQNGINIYANAYSSYSNLYYNNIFNNIIYSNAQNGIYFSANQYNIMYYFIYNNIYSNTIYLNSHNGIYFYAQGTGYSEFNYNSIYNNTVHSNSKKGIYIFSHNSAYHSNIQYNDIYSNIIHSNNDTGLYFYLYSECTSYASTYYYSYFQNNNIYLNTIYSNNQNGIMIYGKCKNGFLYFENNEIFLNDIYWHNTSSGINARTDNSTVSWQSSNIYKNTLDSNLIGLKFLRIRSHIVYINNITNNKNDGVLLEDSYSNTFGYNKIAFNFGNGIHLINNSKTNKIQNNNITQNSLTGIYVIGNSDSNTITRNDIFSNYVMGINISDSMNNMMHHNNLKSNAKNAHDTTVQLNSWDDGIEGNWWDDYAGFDANNDGIGDIPYDVPGGGSKDWYPIIKPANITAPNVESTIPTNGAINISVKPKISVTFSNKMNRSATESAITMVSGVIGVTIWNFTWSNGDLTVTFEPLFTLSSTTKYTVTISIAAKDVLSNNLEDKYQFSFTTKDVIEPYMTLTSPYNWESEVTLNTIVNVTFSEPMNCTTVTFTCSPDPGGWSVAWSSMNTFASFSHTDFGSLTQYTFYISGGKDMSGNDMIISWWVSNPWYFTTVDVEGPEIVTTSPSNGSTGILLNANVVVTFSEQMNITSVTYTCSPDPLGWSASWTNSDQTATYSHNNFTDETTYTFHITAGKDKKDNALNPSVPNPWNFRTQDATPPKIKAISPLNGSKNVLLNANIIVTFNEAMDTNFVTHTCNPNPGGWSVSWSGGDTVATYIHSTFDENMDYTFHITGGKDATGNSMVAGNIPNPWTFTTLDTSAPEITATMPVNGAIDITLNDNIIVTFSEPMDKTTVAYTCSPNPGGWSTIWSAGNTIATYTHDLFTSFTNYTFHITAGKDETGNDLVIGSIPNPWWFKTKDALSPTIISVSPENGTNNVVLTANVVVTFSEIMDTTTVNYICSPNPTGWAVTWSAEDTVATYTHEPFERFTLYTFHISSGKDQGENNLIAGEVNNPWSFTTADNLPPTILTDPIEIATEDIGYVYDIEAFDLNNDILTYQLSSYPSGMTINSSSGEILWTPTNDQVGENPVTLIVSDGRGGADTQSYIITVANVNDVPVITSEPVTTAIEDSKYNYELEAYDIDADDSLTYSLTIFPTGMDIDSVTGLVTWTPTNEQVGTNQVSVKVVDKNYGFAKQLFEITVSNVNDPPEITSTPVTSEKEDGIYVYNVKATDIDPTEDELTFKLTTYPIGMEIDPTTGLIIWPPTNDQVGENNVALEVSDGNSGIDTQSFVINVENVNDPPAIISTPITSAVEDEQYIYDVEAADIDVGDILTFHLTSNPPGMVIDSDSGMITWTPTNDNVGSNPVTVEVVDGGNDRDSQTYTILVVNVNDRPAFTSTPVTNARIDVEYFYDVDASDIDPTEDELTFTLTTYPTGMNIDPTTGAITWTPTPEQEGENNVVVVVADGNGGTNEQAFTISVEPLEATGDEKATKETNDEIVIFNILLILIIIVLMVILFMFVLKPPKLLKGKVKPEEPSEDKTKLPSEPTSGLSPLIAQPAPVPKPKPKIKPEPQPQIPAVKPKPELPPVPKIKPRSEPPVPKIKPKPNRITAPKIKTRSPKPL